MDSTIKSKLLLQAKQYSYLHLDNILLIENAFIAGGEFAFSDFLNTDTDIPAKSFARKHDTETREQFLELYDAFKAGADFILKNN